MASEQIQQVTIPIGGRCSDFGTAESLRNLDEFLWDEDDMPVVNFQALGRRLSQCHDLYRHAAYASGLVIAPARANVPPIEVVSGKRLASVLIDRLRVRVARAGKIIGSCIPRQYLDVMLYAESFLSEFRPIDRVLYRPAFLSNYDLCQPGYNDGGPGERILYVGEELPVQPEPKTICRFLDVMDFAGAADRTNAVAAALTVMLRNHFLGGKPLINVTATKSQSGKDTVIQFAAGNAKAISLSWQEADWAVEKSFVGAVAHAPDLGLVSIENARLGKRTRFISSAFLERFLTDSRPFLHGAGTGPAVDRANDLVLAMSTNYGSVSEDLANRSLPIKLSPVGSVHDRKSEIGNPKVEFLPANRDQIDAELRGMIEAWKSAGMPLDEQARHPFSEWAQTMGGILQVAGFKSFLDNFALRRTFDDPTRRGLALLGLERPDEWLRPSEWGFVVKDLGLIDHVVPPGDRDGAKALARGIGLVLSNHKEERFSVINEDAQEELVLCLEKKRARFDDGSPSTRYRFKVVGRKSLLEASDDS